MRVSLAQCVGVWGVDAESGRWGFCCCSRRGSRYDCAWALSAMSVKGREDGTREEISDGGLLFVSNTRTKTP